MTPSGTATGRTARQRWLARLVLVFVGLALGLAIAEVALRLAGLPHFYKAHSRPGQWWIPRPHQDPLVFYNAPSAHLRFIYDGNPRGYFDSDNGIDHATNSLGFRGPEFSLAKPRHTRRLAFLGDSFTFGDGVRFEDTYPQVTAALLNRASPAGGPGYEALNFGVGSFNTAQEVSLFERDALKFAPDVVVLGYVLNDAEPTLFYFDKRSGRIQRSPQPALEGLDQPHPPDAILYRLRLAQLIWQFVAGRRQSQHTIAYYQSLNRPSNPGLQDSYRWLHRLIADCRERKIPCYIVVFPLLVSLDDHYPLSAAHAQLRREVEGTGAVFIDLFPLLKGRDARQLWVHPTDQHPNQIVDAVAGQALAQAILAHQVTATAPQAGPVAK